MDTVRIIDDTTANAQCIVHAGPNREYKYLIKDSDLFGYKEPWSDSSGERPHYWALDTIRTISIVPRLTPQDHEVGRRMTPETGDMRIMDLGHTYLIEFNQALGLPLPWQLDQKNPQRFTCLEVPSFRKTTMSVSQMMDMGFTTNWYPSHTEILDREGQVVAAGLWEVDKARCVLIKPSTLKRLWEEVPETRDEILDDSESL